MHHLVVMFYGNALFINNFGRETERTSRFHTLRKILDMKTPLFSYETASSQKSESSLNTLRRGSGMAWPNARSDRVGLDFLFLLHQGKRKGKCHLVGMFYSNALSDVLLFKIGAG